MNAWQALLEGNISVPVYRVDAPTEQTGDYVLIRVESQTDQSNNARFVSNVVLVTDVVTRNKSRINDSRAGSIDDEIAQLLLSAPGLGLLPQQTGIQVVDVRRADATYIGEDDGVFRYYRIVTRNLHRVVQHLVNSSQI